VEIINLINVISEGFATRSDLANAKTSLQTLVYIYNNNIYHHF